MPHATAKKLSLLLVVVAVTVPHENQSRSQTLGGTSGLILVPTAEMPEDGTVTFGTSILNGKYLDEFGSHHGRPSYVTLGYLPFLEVSLRLTRARGVSREGLGDRMASVRLRLYEESEAIPSFVVGIHDPVGTRRFHALYAVTSKHFTTKNPVGKVGLHLGYASDQFPADNYRMVGVFGGVSIAPFSFITLLLDYDTEYVNGGVRLSLFNDHLRLVAALQNMDVFAGGVNVSFQL